MNFKHPPGPPMDLANMRRQGAQLRTTPIIHEAASLAIIMFFGMPTRIGLRIDDSINLQRSGFVGGRRGVTFLRLKLTEKLAFRGIIARNLDEH